LEYLANLHAVIGIVAQHGLMQAIHRPGADAGDIPRAKIDA